MCAAKDIIESYNSRMGQKPFFKIPVSFFDAAEKICKNEGLDFLKLPLETFLNSIADSVPEKSEDEEEDDEQNKDFNEYTVEALEELFNHLCTVISCCDESRSASELICGKNVGSLKKPLELYTNYSNMISEKISDGLGERHADAFIAVPDFKFDINVEPITNYRSKNGDHNLSIIHIPPSEFENHAATLRTIAHEVGHQVGQDTKLRRLRSSLYIKCFIYDILSRKCMIDEYGKTEKSPLLIESLKKLTEIITERIISHSDGHFECSDMTGTFYEGSDVLYGETDYYYYTATTFKAINDYLKYMHDDSAEIEGLCEDIYTKHGAPETLLELFESRFSKDSASDDPEDHVSYLPAYKALENINMPDLEGRKKDYIMNFICSAVVRLLDGYLYGKVQTIDAYIGHLKDTEEMIYILFRECYADVFMLLITGYGKDAAERSQIMTDIYFENMLHIANGLTGEDRRSDRLRFCVIYEYLKKQSEGGRIPILPDSLRYVGTYYEGLGLSDRYQADCVIVYLTEAAAALSSLIEKDEYFSALHDIFSRLDADDDRASALADLYGLHG